MLTLVESYRVKSMLQYDRAVEGKANPTEIDGPRNPFGGSLSLFRTEVPGSHRIKIRSPGTTFQDALGEYVRDTEHVCFSDLHDSGYNGARLKCSTSFSICGFGFDLRVGKKVQTGKVPRSRA